jgi:hypothetical protein
MPVADGVAGTDPELGSCAKLGRVFAVANTIVTVSQLADLAMYWELWMEVLGSCIDD